MYGIQKIDMRVSYVYILKCADNTFYTGVTSDLEKRFWQHTSGFYQECYTFKRRPLELVFYVEFTEIKMAIEKEKQNKKCSQRKK